LPRQGIKAIGRKAASASRDVEDSREATNRVVFFDSKARLSEQGLPIFFTTLCTTNRYFLF
jgi:hypothetical protein